MKNRNLLFLIGRPFSPLYSLLMRTREHLYRKRFLPVTTCTVPVVSVGNLTMGGTGKTPVVQYIARLLKEKGRQPAIISRGYGGRSRKRVNIVSDGEKVLLDAVFAGDEPRLLAESLPGVPVLTGAVRKFPAEQAVEMGADVLVLDDGFQHLALGRTLDLVLFNTDSLAGNSRVFPGGDLREPVKALNRSDAFILTGTSARNRDRAEQFAELLTGRFPRHPVFIAGYSPKVLLVHRSGQEPGTLDLEQLRSRKLMAFSGIARPQGFEQTLQELHGEVIDCRYFVDHYQYREQDIRNLAEVAKSKGAEALVTTEKDFVKLRDMETDLPLYAVQMQAEFDDSFHEFLLQRIQPVQSVVH